MCIIASDTIGSMDDLDGLIQERHNSISNVLELRLPCTNPSILYLVWLNIAFLPDLSKTEILQ